MKIIEDEARFDALQMHLTYEIIRAVHHELERAKIAKAKLKELTGAVAFQVCAVLDCSHEMKMEDGAAVRPVVTFAADEEIAEVISGGGVSDMHEHVYGAVDDYFDKS